MKYAKGNAKLGSNCLVVSRAVGDTCPSSCFFLGNGCYAEATEKQYKVARLAGMANAKVSVADLELLLIKAIDDGMSIRFHERGDFGWNNTIDQQYVDAVATACINVYHKKRKLPQMWAYTHFLLPELVKKLGKFIKLYASVHNDLEVKLARKAGFKHLAYIDTDHKFSDKKKRGQNPVVPKYVTFARNKFLVCPEQRMGRERVTCTGGSTTACKWCVRKQGGNVMFVDH